MTLKGLLLSFLLAASTAAAAPPTYSGLIRVPVDLYASDGSRLEKGEYTIQVKQENGQFTLQFAKGDQTKQTVKGSRVDIDGVDPDLGMPIIGAQFLRSSDDPVGTEAQRHFSKTGLPQYEEENRNWKGVLRVYATQDQKEAEWVFEERQASGTWTHIKFIMLLNPK